jgi:predicted aldo/keto reductase-like oxidoreductase
MIKSNYINKECLVIKMENRKIKEQEVSLLGMGCMRLPLVENSDQIDVNKTREMIDYAMKSGITYYDTAYPYHNGKSELVMGEILKDYPRESFLLASKMPSWELKTIDDAKRIFKEQLEKCQVEYFDFYLCHAMNLGHHETYQKLGVYEYLNSLRKEGKIRHLGFSYHDAPQNIIPIADELDWDFAQIQLNYLDYEMQDAKKQYDELTKRNISVVVMEPVRGGLLANVCPEAESLFKEIETIDELLDGISKELKIYFDINTEELPPLEYIKTPDVRLARALNTPKAKLIKKSMPLLQP